MGRRRLALLVVLVSFDPNDVRQALTRQMNAIRGKVPPEIEAKVQSINDTILGILPNYGEFPAAARAAGSRSRCGRPRTGPATA